VDVALAVVPFADIARPAIGVSLLKAGLARKGFNSKIHYFNIEFAETIGDEVYTQISDHTPSDSMAGEWMFAELVFGNQLPPEHEYVRNVLSNVTAPAMVRRIVDSRKHCAEFVERCAQTLKATGAPIIGFTTTFRQTCACLAIAKRLKEMPDPPVICFGGANCEGEMGFEMIRSFPWIDYVCTREGDIVFPEFAERLLRRGEIGELPGFLHRGQSQALTYPAMVEDMDSLPIPDYDDYVDTLEASVLDTKVKREIQIEAARGCWWGAKHHCTFCGLNGDTMPYRSKSPDRVYEELKYLYKRYGYKRIDSVDNILDHRYLTTVFPRLVEEGIQLEMFYEVKANLKYSQLASMKRGGITTIQPGIESFSTSVLKLMDKGVSGAQNVQLLKWAEEVGIMPAWNILAGFPGEAPAEYETMAALLPLLTHLEPPTGCAQIRLDRFSPLFNKADASGLRRVRPTLAYYYVFPLGRRELARLAYFFDFDYDDGRKVDSYITRVQNEIAKWRNARFIEEGARRPKLDAFLQDGGGMHILDSRDCATAPEHWLAGIDAQLVMACDAAQSRKALERQFAASHNREAIADALDRLMAARLFANIDDQYLNLPVLRNRPASVSTNVNLDTQRDAYRQIPAVTNPEPLLRIL
jgi:ribosomal peptide maturation radical SAM protein 1